jgi:hypothetical protein
VGGITRCGLLRQDELLVTRELGPERLALRGESAEVLYVQSRSRAGNLHDGSVQGDLVVERRQRCYFAFAKTIYLKEATAEQAESRKRRAAERIVASDAPDIPPS